MNPQDSQSELTYGYDPASPDGDYSALTIKHRDNFHNFVGDEADAIEAYVTTRVKEAERLARIDERALLERLDLEFEAIRCDNCGEPWTPSDPHDIVLKRLKSLTTTTNGKEEN